MLGWRYVVLLVACGWLAFAPAAAGAAPDKREVQARTDFAAGRYQQAIESFAQLYGETLDPIYLRNIARCHQKLRRPDEAIDAFRDYLRKAKTLSAGERAEVEGYIKEMEALRASQAVVPATGSPPPVAAPAPPPRESAPPEPAPSASATTPAEPARAPAVEPIPGPAQTGPSGAPAAPGPTTAANPNLRASAIAMLPPGSDGGGWRALGVVTTLAGVALVGAGVAWGLSARNASSEVSYRYSPPRAAEGERNETLSIVSSGVGAAAIVTGLLVYAHGMNHPPTMATLSMRARPSLSGNSAGLTLGGEF